MDITEDSGRKQPNLSNGCDGAIPTAAISTQRVIASTPVAHRAADNGAAVALGHEHPSRPLGAAQQAIDKAYEIRARSQEVRLIAEHACAIAAILCAKAADHRVTRDRLASRPTGPLPRPIPTSTT